MFDTKEKNISCIIATHDRDEFLNKAINSAINQTQPPLEIIIVNNIPNKKTREIVEQISAKSSVKINYFEHSMKGRGSISMNIAASKAKGEFIAFLNDDDLWEIDYLEKMMQLLKEKNNKINYSWTWKIKNNQKSPHKKLKENLTMKDFLLTNPGCQISNLVVEKDLFIGLGGFDDYIIPSNDKDFLIRALYFGYNYNVLKENLVIQNKHNDKQITDIDKEFLLGMKKFFKKHEWFTDPILRIKFWIKYWKMYIKIILKLK